MVTDKMVCINFCEINNPFIAPKCMFTPGSFCCFVFHGVLNFFVHLLRFCFVFSEFKFHGCMFIENV